MTCLSIGWVDCACHLRFYDPRVRTTRLWSVSDIARALGITRATLGEEIRAGRFPAPDFVVGRRPDQSRAAQGWRESTVRRWAERKGRPLVD